MTSKVGFLFGSAGSGLGVVLGAYAAHGLEGKLEERLINFFLTGVEYQMYHCLVLLLVAMLMRQWGTSITLGLASFAFILGVLFFSGGIYLFVLTNELWLKPLIPLGGLCFVFGWCLFFYSCFRSID